MVEDPNVVVNRVMTMCHWYRSKGNGDGLAELESRLVQAFSKRDESVAAQLRAENARLRAVAEAAKIVAKSHEQWKKEGCFRNPTAPRAGQFWNEWVYEQLDPALKALEAAREG